MPKVAIQCPNPECRRIYNVSEDRLKKRLRCKACGQSIPGEESTKTMPPPLPGAVTSHDATVALKRTAPPAVADPPVTTRERPATSQATDESPREPEPTIKDTTGADLPTETPATELAAIETAVEDFATTNTSTSGGERLGRFHLRQQVGSGGFGTVYRAHDPVLDREVALKVPNPGSIGDTDSARQFLLEAKASAQLRHPHIVPVHDAGVDGNRLYIAAAFIEGQPLDKILKESGPMEPAKAVEVVIQLAEALDYAHRQGIIHRDVKPHNVMVDTQGQPHLMDFGLARMERVKDPKGKEGTIVGTPAYMSPEQARGSSETPVGPASDQYGLGALMYHLLTGRPPFVGPVRAVIYKVLQEEPEEPRQVQKKIPRDVAIICQKAMSKPAAERYASCGELAEDLRRWQRNIPITARKVGNWERFRKWARRRPAAAGLVVVTLLAAIGLLVGGFWYNTKLRAALSDTERNFTEARKTVDELLDLVADDNLKEIPGVQPVRRKIAQRAVKRYEKFAKERPNDDAVQRGLALAYLAYGTIESQVGSLKDAKDKLKQADEILTRLLKANPDSTDLRYDFAKVKVELGNTYWGAHEWRAAEPHFEEAESALNRLLKEDATNKKYRASLGKTWNQLGNIRRHISTTKESYAAYEKSREIFQKLLGEDPNNIHYLKSLSAPYHNIALIEKGRKNYDLALELFKKSADLDQKAIDLGSRSAILASNMAILAQNRGDVLVSMKRFKEAGESYTESVDRARAVAKANPSVHRYRSFLAWSLTSRATFLKGQKFYQQSRAMLEEAVKIYTEVIELDRTNPEYAQRLLSARMSLAALDAAQKKKTEAIARYRRIMQYGESLGQRFEDAPSIHYRVADCAKKIADHYVREKDDKRALPLFEKAVDIYLTKVVPSKTDGDRDTHTFYFSQTVEVTLSCRDRLKRPKSENRKLLDAAIPYCRKGEWRETKQNVVLFLNRKGKMLDADGDTDGAIATYSEAVEIAAPLLKEFPWHFYLRSGLSGAYLSLAKLYRKKRDYRNEVLVSRKRLEVWEKPKHSLDIRSYVDPRRRPTEREAIRLRRVLEAKRSMKKFTIPCDFGGVKFPFDVYITNTPPDVHPLGDQAKWLWEERGGVIPKDVMDSFEKLRAIAKKNKVNFPDLCVYALGAANKKKTKSNPRKSRRRKRKFS